MFRRFQILLPFTLLALAIGPGCRPKASEPSATAEAAFSRERPRRVIFQADWFPQGEHGGFYQALAKGFYAEVGLAVEIRPGGPGANVKLLVARGDVDFGINRVDNLILAAANENFPLVMVAGLTQHDHTALMIHAASPVHTFADLAGRTITASPGQAWIYFLQSRYQLTFNQVPNNGGLASFFTDPTAIRQCVFTNEPFLARERGMPVRLLELADSGYDVPTGIFCRRRFGRENPAATRAFVAASLRGWRDFLEGDPSPATEAILKANPAMTAGLLNFSREELDRRRVIAGDPAKGEGVGRISIPRLRAIVATLVELKMLEAPLAPSSFVTEDFLPVDSR